MKDEKKCPICGKWFLPHFKQFYCSRDCSMAAKRAAYRRRDERKKEQRREKRGTLCCKVCGKEITDLKRRRYCSEECYKKSECARKKEQQKNAGKKEKPKKPKKQKKHAVGEFDAEKRWEYTARGDEDVSTCIRCLRPRAEGSNLCEFHLKIKKRIAEKGFT